MMRTWFWRAGVVTAVLALAACGGEKQEAASEHPQETAPTAASTDVTPEPGRKTIVVEMHTDENGNYFKPNEIEAEKGDVISFKLVTGVHNVHFLPDSNPGKAGLPKATDFAQLPGQTIDIPVTMGPGKYYFQCDPHAALGMTGHLKVEH